MIFTALAKKRRVFNRLRKVKGTKLINKKKEMFRYGRSEPSSVSVQLIQIFSAMLKSPVQVLLTIRSG